MRRRRSRSRGDPNYPKPNRSGYNFFFAEKHCKLKSLYPNREREFTKMIGESWSKLGPEERMVTNCSDSIHFELKKMRKSIVVSRALASPVLRASINSTHGLRAYIRL